MDDLISRQAAIDALNEVSEHYTEKGRTWHPHVDFMVEAIKEVPTIDAVPVVRCKDCKYRTSDNKFGWVCDNDSADPYDTGRMPEDDDWFCADGERRDDGSES